MNQYLDLGVLGTLHSALHLVPQTPSQKRMVMDFITKGWWFLKAQVLLGLIVAGSLWWFESTQVICAWLTIGITPLAWWLRHLSLRSQDLYGPSSQMGSLYSTAYVSDSILDDNRCMAEDQVQGSC